MAYGFPTGGLILLTGTWTGLETGWDLGHFAAVLAPEQTSPPATKYKETIRD